MKSIKTLVGATLLSLCAGTAFAGNSYTYHFKNLESSSSAPTYEQVVCVIKNANYSDLVTARKHAEMITGFNSNNRLRTNVVTVNTVYFSAYHDPDPKYSSTKGSVRFTVHNKDAQIQCYTGTVAPGDEDARQQMPGPYEKSHSSN